MTNNIQTQMGITLAESAKDKLRCASAKIEEAERLIRDAQECSGEDLYTQDNLDMLADVVKTLGGGITVLDDQLAEVVA